MSRLILAGSLALLLHSSSVSAQSIGIFIDEEATTCIAEVGSTPYVDLHIVAVLGGDVTGLTGAQFQITGVPTGWTPSNTLWVPNEGVAVSLGHPMFTNPIHEDTPGLNVAFNVCQTLESREKVPLGRIILLGAPTPRDVHLRVEHFELVPSDPECSFVTDCDWPVLAPTCVEGGEAFLNGNGPSGCGSVPVEDNTWSSVKMLFR